MCSLWDVKDSDLSCGADAGISIVLDDIAEPGEFTCDQVKEATCAAACMEAEGAGIIQEISFAIEKATNDIEIKHIENTILEEYASNHTPSDTTLPKVKDSVAIEYTTDCD